MKVERHDGEPERSILIAFIVSTEFLTKIAPKFSQSLFRSEWSATIADWCVAHFNKYGNAPGKRIASIFRSWAEQPKNEDTQKSINRLLSSLSKQYKSLARDIDVKYTVDLALTYFNQVMVEKHIEELRTCLDRGHKEKALQEAEKFKRLEIDDDPPIDVLRDKEAQRLALEQKQNVLIKYKDGLGTFFGSELSEDSLIVFVAPMKVGKSYYMLDLAWRAMKQGKKVAYFQVGDLSRNQIMQRFHSRAAYRPLDKRVVRFPMSIIPSQHGLAQVEFDTRVFEKELTTEAGQKAFEKACKDHDDTRLNLSWHPTKSVSMNDIRKKLESWDRLGWSPKVIVIDYSENLTFDNPKQNVLEGVEEMWASMSKLREERKCLVVSAIQAPREAFNAWVMTKRHFSKNKMIFAHATAVIGLNQTNEEKQQQVMRLNFIARRSDDFSETKCCYVAECRDMCHVTVCSSF